MTGLGPLLGEYGGASTLVARALHAVAAEWTMRGPPTALTEQFVNMAAAADAADLLEGITLGRYQINAQAAPLVFRTAEAGDQIAQEVIRWSGEQLGSLVNGVIHQLNFQKEIFDVVEVGGLFEGGALLADPLHETVWALAPSARFVRLEVPPVVGAVLLAMEQLDIDLSFIRNKLLAVDPFV